jgi:ribosomal protein L11 methyltransferase
MKGKKISIKTTAEAEDIIISTMYDIGLEGAQIEDKVPLTAWEKEQMFVDILPDAPDDDHTAVLNFFVEVADEETDTAALKSRTDLKPGVSDGVDASYFPISNPGNVDMDRLLADVKRELEDLKQFMDIGEGTVTVSETEDKDWMNNWKEFFHQFYIDDLLVIPSWEEVKPEDRDKKILHIDPGTAFGTGMHETTQLCIRQLRKYITEDTVLLDVGTGSGILAIVSLMYGIKEAVGTDLDPCAVDAVAENCAANGVDPEKFELMIGNIIDNKEIGDKAGYEKYDIVVANILAEVLLPLTPVVLNHLKKGGIYITSGILATKEQLVVDAVKAAGMELLEVTRQGEWVSVTARK